MKTCVLASLIAALLLVSGCNIQFATPAFPVDTGEDDTISGDASVDGVTPDVPGPDGVEPPDLAGQVCQDLEGGICVSEDDAFEKNHLGCPWGFQPYAVDGCEADTYCCAYSDECQDAGTVFNVNDEGIGCCPWLGSVDVCYVGGFEACDCPGDEYICTDCGDGSCDVGENPCVCPADCEWGKNPCKENGGECADGCPPGHEQLSFGGCQSDQVCCAIEQTCLDAGGMAEDAPGSPPCCGGLQPIPATVFVGGGTATECMEDEAFYVCTNCGDGVCEEWESECTCKEDCLSSGDSCADEGGTCKGVCPNGWTPIGPADCPEGKKCCMPSPECIGAGGGIAGISPDDQWCCEGLEEIPDSWMTENGACAGTPGGICSDCGNQACEPWENPCNCEEDCGIGPFGCDPNGGQADCPDQAFCAAPPYACEAPGVIGECILPDGACPMIYAPVCSCKGSDFDNECLAHQAFENVAWFGTCVGDDGAECVGLGVEVSSTDISTAECCGDLDKKSIAFPDELSGLCEDAPGFVCVMCGDDICGLGENFCICPNDCPGAGVDDPVPGGNG